MDNLINKSIIKLKQSKDKFENIKSKYIIELVFIIQKRKKKLIY